MKTSRLLLLATLILVVGPAANTLACEEPSIAISKSARPTVSKVGDEVVYRISITNNGGVPLKNVVVMDTLLGGPLPGFPSELAVGQNVQLDFPYTIQPADPDPLINYVTVTAETVDCSCSESVEASAYAEVDLVHPAWTVSKLCLTEPLAPGEDAEFEITIKNTGDVLLVFETDEPEVGTIALAAGETYQAIVIRTAGQTDVQNTINLVITLDPCLNLDNVYTDSASDTCMVEVPGEEGCTPGYWKNHPGCWECFSPDDLFSDVFGRVITIGHGKKAVENPTLMQALNGYGGGVTALARHAVAAILNACDQDIAYPMGVGQVIAAVDDALDMGEPYVTELKDTLDYFNNYGCPQDAHCRPIEDGEPE